MKLSDLIEGVDNLIDERGDVEILEAFIQFNEYKHWFKSLPDNIPGE